MVNFSDKYCSTTEKDKLENKDKLILSDDAYAVGEALNLLVHALSRLGVGR